MPRQRTPAAPTGHTILVVDDNQEYLVAAERILTRCGHSVVALENPVEALALLRHTRFDLVLVDFFMPEMTGEAFVTELRSRDPLVHVILQTGYASEMPPRELVRRLDIQGYYDEGEGPDKLLLWADVGLKAARIVQRLDRERTAQRAILDAAMELHGGLAATALWRAILARTTGLLQVLSAFRPMAGAPTEPAPDVFVATWRDTEGLAPRAGTGRFAEAPRALSQLGAEALAGVTLALTEGAAQTGPWGTAVPLSSGGAPLGVIFADNPAMEPEERALFQIFADHAALALRRLGDSLSGDPA